ncbi:restriction endonuclease subunit S [Klebsiella pasteurii]|uniref:Restriction endonuclease subunit S n=1 Tax=Klebsiella pasteurii TaxID=2587529 RepID=A0ABT5CZA9_9ENTR|nr:restriction endonuclease subunit S [Klebsiella pasteurii]MDC0695426.1 restriction endonuclease subunit S [Klebsiella pasteurii]MDC0757649.1 restriction endonuclease subunit S [Klebsiella pasteurii]MDQ2171858.1 restriction endonuclease subunit S [Klebsiella pasteurii]MDQ2204067.1 restriction endonuclease subunit S [Klebsiella pasteurii]MDQ2228012.1 restriction endonuclease subunit S [Klebsiella pasteurii]
MAVEKLIVDHIDTWTTALQTRSTAGRGSSGKIDLYGIKKLRELILELAVRGKLVPQDPNDEPAPVLLERNEERKKELSRNEGMKTTASPHIHGNEYYIDAPENWSWIRLGNLAKFIDYRGKTPHKQENGIRLITAKNIRKGYIDLSPEEFIAEEDYTSWMTRGFPKCGDILFTTEAPLGNAAIIDLDGKFALAQRSICFQWHIPEISPFMLIQIMAMPFQSQLNDKSTGMTAAGIKASKLKEIPVILPPYQEQTRIVSRVQDLMSLCDQLEQHSLTSLDAHQQLVETLLTTLTDSLNADELAENWARISEHFDTLFTTEASIDALKQTILQLAVMGKLVPQDPNDKPASELLKRIAQEKAELVKDGKIKKQKPLPPISDEEKPFELPEGWEWAQLQDICHKITDGEHSTPQRSTSGHYLLSARNVTNNGITLDDVDFVPTSVFNKIRERCDPNIGDILISCSGSIGRVALVDRDDEYSMVRSAAMIRPNKNLYIHFIENVLKSPLLQYQMVNRSKKSAQANLFLGSISALTIPIPPYSEQVKIYEIISKLFSYSVQLRTKISTAQQTQLHLADALTDAAIN